LRLNLMPFRFSRTFDTVGEFPSVIDGPELGQDGPYWKGKSPVPDAPGEFANSITFDDPMPPTGAAVPVFQGILGRSAPEKGRRPSRRRLSLTKNQRTTTFSPLDDDAEAPYLQVSKPFLGNSDSRQHAPRHGGRSVHAAWTLNATCLSLGEGLVDLAPRTDYRE